MTNVFITATEDCDGSITCVIKNLTGTGIIFSVFVARRVLGTQEIVVQQVPAGDADTQIQGPFTLANGATRTIVFQHALGDNDFGFDGNPVLEDGRTPIVHGGGTLSVPINCLALTTPAPPTTTPVVTTTVPETTTAVATTTTTIAIQIGTPETFQSVPLETTTTIVARIPSTGTNAEAVAGLSSAFILLGIIAAIFGRKVRYRG